MKKLFERILWVMVIAITCMAFAITNCKAQSAKAPDTLVVASVTTSTQVQCSAMTADGDRCMNKTRNASGICTQHEKQSKITRSEKKAETSQCTFICKDGHQCRNMTSDPSWKCWKHR